MKNDNVFIQTVGAGGLTSWVHKNEGIEITFFRGENPDHISKLQEVR